MQFPCPKCRKSLKLRDGLAGKNVKCPSCQAIVVVPDEGTEITEAGPLKVSASDYPDCPECDRPMERGAVVCLHCGFNTSTGKRLKTRVKRSAKKQALPQQLGRVRLGLAFHYARLVIFLVTPVVLILAVILGAMGSAGGAMGRVGAGAVIAIVGILLILALLATPILGLVGSILCAWAPRRTRMLILISLGLDLGGLVLTLMVLILSLAGEIGANSGVAVLFRFAQWGMTLAAWVLFMLFLRRLAYEFEEWGRGDEAASIVYTGALMIVGPPVVLGLLSILAASARDGSVANMIVGLMFLLVIVYIYLILKFAFRQLEFLQEMRTLLAKQIAEG